MTLEQRIPFICSACAPFKEFLGSVTEDNLTQWVSAELGNPKALDEFIPYGSIHTKAIPKEPILAIISSNAPHSGLQTILRSLVLEAKTRIKLPSSGSDSAVKLLEKLSKELHSLFEVETQLPEHWLESPTVIAFGRDETIQEIHQKLSPQQTFLPHGHKLSIGIVFEAKEEAAQLAAQDIARFNQQGCLSAVNIFVSQEDACTDFAELLHQALQKFECDSPRGPINLSESGAIRNLRETIRYQAANDTNFALFESDSSTAHTVIVSPNPEIETTPLNRTVLVKALPSSLDSKNLGPEHNYLSSVGIYPFSKENASKVEILRASRICALGKLQEPTLFWHHDGFPTLASLVTWKDLG